MLTDTNQESILVFEIVPGKSIGPFHLGMTSAEIDEVSRQTGIRTDTGPVRGAMLVEFDRHDRAVRITTAAEIPSVRYAIAGEELKSLFNEHVRSALAKIAPLPNPVHNNIDWNWTEPPDSGIVVFHWEMGDKEVFAFMVFSPGHRFPET